MAVLNVPKELAQTRRSRIIAPRPLTGVQERKAQTFTAALEEAETGELRREMETLLGRIMEFSDRLSGSLSRDNLDAYRGAVRQFLGQVIDRSVQLRRDISEGNLLSVRRVNASLERLGNLVLEREQDRIKLLDELGEIKGLLLSIKV